tara:strand:- start:631 stop:1323 length:693 start_codon:yes stop_codon:yes gene_type:complete
LDLNKEKMRLEHQIKNVINRIDEKAKDTPGQGGMKEHPISKKTSDYEEKFFQHADGKDDREKFITGKKPEHKDNVEDTEGHENPAEKSKDKAPKESEEQQPTKDDMNIELKQVKDLTEKKQPEKEAYNVKMAAAALKGDSHMDMGGEKHPVKMDKKTAKKIMKDVKAGEIEKVAEKVSFADAVRLAQDTAVQSQKEYWEEAAKKREEGWGGKGGVPGKGSVVTLRKKNGK